MTKKPRKIPITKYGASSDLQQLEVLLNDISVGTLVCIPPDRILFTLGECYISHVNRPTLTLPLRGLDEKTLTDLLWKSNVVLPAFFSNLLPEGHLRTYLAELSGVQSQREFRLIKALGEDLPGAVRVAPLPVADRLHFEQFGKTNSDQQALRFSLGGVQLKFSAVMEAAGGLTIPVDGVGGSMIVKLSSAQLASVPENEYSMMMMAKAMGINAAQCQLVETQSIKGLPHNLPERFHTSLAVTRFDRPKGTRTHTEDLAQVFGMLPEDKYTKKIHYNHIAKLLWQYIGESALCEFIKRLVFNIAICNTDMHLKNWSLIYPDGQNPELAPAYDLVSTYCYVGHRGLALKLGNVREMAQVNINEFRVLAERAGLPQHLVLTTVQDSIDRFHSVWHNDSCNLPIPQEVRLAIGENLKKVPLFWKF